MLSEDEKNHIVERVQFENALRKEVIEKSEPKKFAWLENKITLLVVGALLTGVFVPIFQYTQKLWEVKRQNQFNNLTFTLNATPSVRFDKQALVRLWRNAVIAHLRRALKAHILKSPLPVGEAHCESASESIRSFAAVMRCIGFAENGPSRHKAAQGPALTPSTTAQALVYKTPSHL